MIIHSIELKNFLGTRKISDKNGIVKINLPKDKNNIILISGENGLGKSTILENLTPYSSMLKRDLKLCITYPAHKKIVIQKNGIIYHLETFFEDEKTKKGYIYTENSNGEKEIMEDTSKGNITEFDYQVEKIFGDFNKFKNSSFLKQGATDIVEAKPAERLEIINKFMPTLEVYDKSKNYCNDKTNILKSEIEKKNIRKKNIEEFSFKYERIKEQEKKFTQEIIQNYKEEKNKLDEKKDEYIKVEEERKHLLSNIELKEKNNKEIEIIDGLELNLITMEEKLIEIDERHLWNLEQSNNNIKSIVIELENKKNDEILFTNNEDLEKINKEVENLIAIEKKYIQEKELIKNKENEKQTILNDIKNINILENLDKKEEEFKLILKNLETNELKNLDLSKINNIIEIISNNISMLKTLNNNNFSISEELKIIEEISLKEELQDLNAKKDDNLKVLARKEELCLNKTKYEKELIKFENTDEKINKINLEIENISKNIKNIDCKRYEDFIEEMKNFSQTFKNMETKKFSKDLISIENELKELNEKLIDFKQQNELNISNKNLISNIKEKIKKEEEKLIEVPLIHIEDLEKMEKRFEALNKKIYRLEDLSNNLKHLEAECVCPTCNKSINEEELNNLKEELKEFDLLVKERENLSILIEESKKTLKINENNTSINIIISSLQEELKSLIVTEVTNKDIEEIEVKINELKILNKDFIIISNEIENLKQYNDFITNFNFEDLDKLYEELKVIFYSSKETLNNEKNSLEKKKSLDNELELLLRDKNSMKHILESINTIDIDLTLLTLNDVDLTKIKEKESEIEKVKFYLKEYQILKEVSKNLNELSLNEELNFNIDYSNINNNIEELNKILLLKKEELNKELEVLKKIEEVKSNLNILQKDIETNNNNISLKNNMIKKLEEIEIILNKDRIIFDENKMISLKNEQEFIKNNMSFINTLKEKLDLIKINIHNYTNYEMLLKDIEVLLSNNNLEIEKFIVIKEKNDVIKNEIKELKEKIQKNLININTFNNNIKDIELSKEKISQLKEIDFNFDDYNKFILDFEEFNEELKKFLIDKTDIEIKYKEYEDLEKEIKSLEEEEFIWKRLKAISIKIKKSIISSTFAEITDSANEILENEGTISLKLAINQINDKKFEIKAIDTKDNTSVSDISLLSGAEAMAVTKAISFSLSKKTEHKVLWLDESDGVLSKANKNLFVDMLKKLWDNFDLDEIFVISHQDEVKKMVDVTIDLNKLVKK